MAGFISVSSANFFVKSKSVQNECVVTDWKLVFQGDWGIPQQAILKVSAEEESWKNSKPLLVYTACQFASLWSCYYLYIQIKFCDVCFCIVDKIIILYHVHRINFKNFYSRWLDE